MDEEWLESFHHNMPTFRVAPRGCRRIEADTQEILRQHAPDTLVTPQPLDVIYMLEFVLRLLGATVESSVRLDMGILAFTCARTGRVVISEDSYQDAWKGGVRGRFTIIHEVIHWFWHVPELRRMMSINGFQAPLMQGQYAAQMARAVLRVPAYENPEWQANQGAAALLMPEPTLRQVLAEEGFDNPIAVARTFGVSSQAASIRIRKYLEYCDREGICRPY